MNPHLGDKLICSATDEMIDSFTLQGDGKYSTVQGRVAFLCSTSREMDKSHSIFIFLLTQSFSVKESSIEWSGASEEGHSNGQRLIIKHAKVCGEIVVIQGYFSLVS